MARIKLVKNNGGSRNWRRPVVGVRSKPRPAVSGVRNNGSGHYSWRRPVVAVKSKPSIIETGGGRSNNGGIGKTLDHPDLLGHSENEKDKASHNLNETDVRRENLNGVEPREKVRRLLELFRGGCSNLRRATGKDKERRVDLKAWKDLISEGMVPKRPERILGKVPGIEIGDKFNYRIELLIAGLHSRTQNGIDYTHFRGCKLATCVVATEGYSDKMDDSNVLLYTGEGGIHSQSAGTKDQKLVGGNLALYNSLKRGREVRVVRGLKHVGYRNARTHKTTYIYDGLYDVTGCEKERGPMGNMIFQFELTRRPSQKFVYWKQFC